jgi:transcriptional regulator with XRE-family HTH domain
VDAKSEIREFLTSRRARITPERAGLPRYGENRRVPGLRREEVALLAGVSVDYYTRLERGNAAGVSETVLDALARALQLDDVERAHLFALVRAQSGSAPQRRRAQQKIRPTVTRLLDAMTGAPAFVRNDRLDLLAANRLGRALYSQHFDSPHGPANTARFGFLDARAREFYIDWERVAHDIVALLHATAGRDPYDRDLSELVGQLSMQSETFRTLWAAHDVWRHDTGTKRVHHPIVGEMTLTYESMQLAADPGLTMFVYTAEPGTKSEEALSLLGSWAATADEEELDADHAEQHRDHTRAG